VKDNRWIEAIGALFLIGAGMIFLLDNLGLLPNLQPLAWASLLLGGGLLFLIAFLFDRSQWWTVIAGFALVGAGAAALAAGVLHLPGEVAAGAVFGSLAAGFAGAYLAQRRENWWALIPAGATLLLALVTLLGAVMGELAGMVFFLGIGLAFVGVYFAEIDGRRHHWWALIPAGALFSLAVVVLLATLHLDALAGSALFLGLSLTFGVLYLLRGPERPLDWAWIPALALLGFGLFVMAAAGDPRSAGIVAALALIVGGLALALRPSPRHRRRLE
jgi:hypothetical protein